MMRRRRLTNTHNTLYTIPRRRPRDGCLCETFLRLKTLYTTTRRQTCVVSTCGKRNPQIRSGAGSLRTSGMYKQLGERMWATHTHTHRDAACNERTNEQRPGGGIPEKMCTTYIYKSVCRYYIIHMLNASASEIIICIRCAANSLCGDRFPK